MSDTSTPNNVTNIGTRRTLNSRDLFRGGDTPYTRVEVPGFALGDVYVAPLTTGDILAISENNNREGVTAREKAVATNRLVGKLTVDENGERIFSNEDIDSGKLADLPMSVFNALISAIYKRAGLEPKDAETRAAVEGDPTLIPGVVEAGNA